LTPPLLLLLRDIGLVVASRAVRFVHEGANVHPADGAALDFVGGTDKPSRCDRGLDLAPGLTDLVKGIFFFIPYHFSLENLGLVGAVDSLPPTPTPGYIHALTYQPMWIFIPIILADLAR
jgi:hypothetical protein